MSSAVLTDGLVFLLMILNFLVSYEGFRERSFFDKYKFETENIVEKKEYIRLLSSGFLHVSWLHLGFNMLSFYSFASSIGQLFGASNLLLIYLGSLVGGNLLALYIHRNHADYQAVGASGAVSGVIFAAIITSPHLQMGIPMTDIRFPAWSFGLVFIAVSIYGIRTQRDNIGHEAHLGGAIVGVLLALLLKPILFKINLWLTLLILLPLMLFIALLAWKPEILFLKNPFSIRNIQKNKDRDDKLNYIDDDELLDILLEKVSEKGLENLTKKEKQKLDELSQKVKI